MNYLSLVGINDKNWRELGANLHKSTLQYCNRWGYGNILANPTPSQVFRLNLRIYRLSLTLLLDHFNTEQNSTILTAFHQIIHYN